MKCNYPQHGQTGNRIYEYPCGQCMPCRINRRNQWAGRILLESVEHRFSYFITLTYDSDHPLASQLLVPGTDNFDAPTLTLEKSHLQNFLKRLRKQSSISYRYYAVGEYGEKNHRPHFHLVVFTELEPNHFEQEVIKAWSLNHKQIGYVTVSELNAERAQYVAQYTTKKLTSEKSFSDGRAPEFSLMSRKPSIGHAGCIKMAQALKKHLDNSTNHSLGLGDPMKNLMNIWDGCFRHNGRTWSLDRYCKELIVSQLMNLDEFKKDRLQKNNDNLISLYYGEDKKLMIDLLDNHEKTAFTQKRTINRRQKQSLSDF